MQDNNAGIASSTKTLRSIKLKEPVIVSPQATVLDAAVLMAEKNSDSVLVVGMTGDTSTPTALKRPLILGIVTVKDAVNRVMAKGLDPSKTIVSKVMTSPVTTVTPETSLYRVVLLMNQNNFRQVPVLESDRVIGTVTSSMINTSIMSDIIEDIKLIATIFR